MKAIVCERLGDPGSLKEIPTPQPGPHELLIRVIAAGVNPIDWKRRERPETTFPLVLGQDFAGVVSATGNRVTKYAEGQRVFGIAWGHGSFAEYTIAPEDDRQRPIAKIPDVVGDADAASLPTAGATALGGLDALNVTAGTTLLVLGATGGVGGFAARIAKDRGARVIGTGSAANEGLAASLGLDEYVAYDRGDVVEAVKALCPNGVDAAYDLVDGAAALERVATLVRDGGAIASTIGAADEAALARRNVTGRNIYAMETPAWSHAGLRTLLDLLERGVIGVRIARELPLSEAVEGLEESKAGRVNGRLVIMV
ncbi:MAG TPA: NADP-dependent oxidoreductase [Candidatus Binatia bacterium]|nr:NADP-dependent oxidoreductase [Candidatus Binatia bacterium]